MATERDDARPRPLAEGGGQSGDERLTGLFAEARAPEPPWPAERLQRIGARLAYVRTTAGTRRSPAFRVAFAAVSLLVVSTGVSLAARGLGHVFRRPSREAATVERPVRPKVRGRTTPAPKPAVSAPTPETAPAPEPAPVATTPTPPRRLALRTPAPPARAELAPDVAAATAPAPMPTETSAAPALAPPPMPASRAVVRAPEAGPHFAGRAPRIRPDDRLAHREPLAPELEAFTTAMSLLRARRDNAAALTALDEYLRSYPTGLFVHEARLGRVDALLALGRRGDAREAMDALPLGNDALGLELTVTRGELRAGTDCKGALADFDRALAGRLTDPLAERALFGRAVCRTRQGRAAEARADLEEYLRRFPSGARAEAARGRLR